MSRPPFLNPNGSLNTGALRKAYVEAMTEAIELRIQKEKLESELTSLVLYVQENHPMEYARQLRNAKAALREVR